MIISERVWGTTKETTTTDPDEATQLMTHGGTLHYQVLELPLSMHPRFPHYSNKHYLGLDIHKKINCRAHIKAAQDCGVASHLQPAYTVTTTDQ